MRRLLFMILLGCFSLQVTFGNPAGLHADERPRQPNPDAIKLEPGYKIEPVVVNLSVPTTAIFDGDDLLVGESGWKNTAKPRVLRIKRDGTVSTLASVGLEGPVTGLLVYQGRVYVSHKTKVSVIEENGSLRHIVTDLPSGGDHQNNNLVAGPDGKIYIGQGTTTNSAVVGVDNFIFGWLNESPGVHDVPCQDIQLVGSNFESDNPLQPGSKAKVVTGAYKPFGTASTPGERIKGDVKCNGAILRFNPDGTGLEVVAWGLRNPFGLKFDPSGQLWATFHGADVRGSRNIYNDPDYLVRVEAGAWYGWPDYFDGLPVTDARFQAPGRAKPEFLWQQHPPLTKAYLTFATHEGVNGFAFSPGGAFGFQGEIIVAMFGTFAPVTTGTNLQSAGFRLLRVNLQSKQISEFAANKLPGPSYVNQGGGFDRPSDVAFAPDQSLYVVDWGASTITQEGLKLVPQSGVIWRIYPDKLQPARASGPIVVEPAPVPPEERKPEVRNVPEFYQQYALELAIVGGVLLLIVFSLAAVVLRARRSAK